MNHRDRKAAAPFLLELILSNRCNMDCSYCSSGFMIHEKTKKVFAFEQLKRAVDVYAACLEENGLRGRGLISFTGNEPLLEFELLKKVAGYIRGKKEKIRLRLDTNAVLLDAEKVDFLLANDVRVFISLDGCRKAHDYHRRFRDRGRSSFDVILKNLQKIPPQKRHGDKFCIWAVITPETIEFFPETLEFFRRLGFGVVVLCLETYGRWDRAAIKRLKDALRDLKSNLPETLGREAVKGGGEPVQFLFGLSEASDYRGIIGQAVSLAFDGCFYPCDFALIPPLKKEFRVGDLENGIDLKRIEKFVSLPMFANMSRKCEHKSGLRSPVERYYWGLAHEFSPAKLDRDLEDTSRVNQMFNEEMGGYLKLLNIHERLITTPSFGDFVHPPKYAGDKEIRRFRVILRKDPDVVKLREDIDYFLYSPGSAKKLVLDAMDNTQISIDVMEGMVLYVLMKAGYLKKKIGLTVRIGASALDAARRRYLSEHGVRVGIKAVMPTYLWGD